MIQLFHDLGVIIDALEKNHLIVEYTACVCETSTSFKGFQSTFFRMIEMSVNKHRMILSQHIRKTLGHPEREGHEIASPNSENFDMIHGTQARQYIFEPII